MDPVSQLGRNAYYALCVAFAAKDKDKLYAPETDVLLEEARELLGVSEEEDEAFREQIEKDPMIAALRRGEMPPGGVRLPGGVALPRGGAAAAAAAGAYGSAHGGMPPPGGAAAGGGGGGGYDMPYSAPAAMQQKAAAPKKAAPPPPAAAAPPAAASATSALLGRKLQRLFPDLSPPWVTGTIVQFNPANGKHLIQYGPPLRKELWDCIEDFAPQNFRWVEPGSEPAPTPGSSKAGGGSKTGGSKSTSKSTTPRAPPPPPPRTAPPPPAAVAALAAPPLHLPGGPSSFHATGVSLTSVPYNDAFLRTTLAKNRTEDLFTMLSSLDDREVTVVRQLVALLEDPGDIADINRLLDESQQLGQREQQLRAELQQLGVS